MKEFAPDVIVHMVKVLVNEARDTPEGDTRIIAPTSPFKGLLGDMTSWCEERGLNSTYDLLVRIGVSLASGSLTAGEVAALTSDLIHRIQDDMARSVYLRLEDDEPKYYKGTKLDWGLARERFPIADDADEGSKCFGLGRYPAAVFHMMRVLDIGLHALAEELEVPFSQHYSANWENIINDIEARTKQIPSTDPDRKLRLHFYSAAASHFFFVKEAWRNYVMHVKASHNQGSALMVMLGVSEFMKQLAAERPWTRRG